MPQITAQLRIIDKAMCAGQLSWQSYQVIATRLESVILKKLVSWSLTSLFSTNMAISETKGQGWKVIRTQ